jgi:hypothetical protein
MGYVCRLGLYFCLEPNRRTEFRSGSAFIYRRNGIMAALPHYNAGLIKNKGAASGCGAQQVKPYLPPKIACGCWMAGRSGEPEERVALRSLEQVEGARKRLDKRQLQSSRIGSM